MFWQSNVKLVDGLNSQNEVLLQTEAYQQWLMLAETWNSQYNITAISQVLEKGVIVKYVR